MLAAGPRSVAWRRESSGWLKHSFNPWSGNRRRPQDMKQKINVLTCSSLVLSSRQAFFPKKIARRSVARAKRPA
jgi:hypothetical protein